jgi:ABC-type transport system substrate-binding protein
MKLVAPTTCVARTQWAETITENFQAIGIDVELKWWNWNIVMPRIYFDPKGVGYNYDHEGVDAWFMGMNMFIDPDLSSQYFIIEFPPDGNNAFWIENDEVTAIINRSLTNPDLRERLVALSDYQHWFSEQVPKSIIRQGLDIIAMDKNLQGFDTYLVGRGWCFNNWTIGSQTELTYTVPGDFVDFNPLLSNSYYDFVPMSNVFGALAQRRGNYNLTHLVPQIAENWTHNKEATTWEVKIKPNIKWSDGTNLSVEDVLFNYHAVFEDDLASPKQKFFLERFPGNASNIYLKTGTTDTIVFELGAFYPYVTSQVFGLPILQKAQLENITFGAWKTHTLNTGHGSEFYIGCGPYMMTDFDPFNGVTLEKNPYFNPTTFGHDPTAVGGGIFFNEGTFETIHVVVVKEATTAVAGLASGVYDVLDSQTGVNAQYEDLNEPDNEYESKCIFALEYGWQELNYNHYDPRWGMNAHDPREMYRDEYIPKNLLTELSYLILGALYPFLAGVLVIFSIFIILFLKRKISEIP